MSSRPPGRVIIVSDEAIASAEEGPQGVAGVDELELADARGVLSGGTDYVQLPDRFEINEYRMMEQFAAGVTDPSARTELQDALHGRGAFRRFKDAVRRHDLAVEWYGYRDRSYEDVARAWCDERSLVIDSSEADA